jgi:hypothetical protein
MSAEDVRRPPAHEQLNEIADRLDATASHDAAAEHPSPYAERLQPAHDHAATPAPQPAAPTPEPVASIPDPSAATPAPEQPAIAPSRAAGEPQTSAAQPEPMPVPPSQDSPARQSESTTRNVLIVYFPMLIAIMSLGMSTYQGYLFQRSIELSQRSLDLVERNVARGEFMRTCRELSETYFEIRPKIGVLMPTPDRGNVAGASRVSEHSRLEAQAVVARFGGLGTYLANFSPDPGTRARYTQLTRTLTGILDSARTTPLTELEKLFEPADKLFTTMNDDCVRLARTTRL